MGVVGNSGGKKFFYERFAGEFDERMDRYDLTRRLEIVFDELLGSIGAMLDVGGFTGTLKVVYRSLTPLGIPIRMRSWVDRQEGVKTFIKGEMYVDEGAGERLCSEAEGIFIRPKVSVLEDAIAKSKGGGAS